MIDLSVNCTVLVLIFSVIKKKGFKTFIGLRIPLFSYQIDFSFFFFSKMSKCIWKHFMTGIVFIIIISPFVYFPVSQAAAATWQHKMPPSIEQTLQNPSAKPYICRIFFFSISLLEDEKDENWKLQLYSWSNRDPCLETMDPLSSYKVIMTWGGVPVVLLPILGSDLETQLT